MFAVFPQFPGMFAAGLALNLQAWGRPVLPTQVEKLPQVERFHSCRQSCQQFNRFFEHNNPQKKRGLES
jgi:hypothetical protein